MEKCIKAQNLGLVIFFLNSVHNNSQPGEISNGRVGVGSLPHQHLGDQRVVGEQRAEVVDPAAAGADPVLLPLP